MRSTKVAHITSVHPRFDTRIFHKQCSSLVSNGYDVTLFVADGQGDQAIHGINVADVGKPRSRLARMLVTTLKLVHRAITLDAEIYHLHDPELLLVALYLKFKGKTVIFDAHEDLPKQILSKPYINKKFRKVIAAFASILEIFICRRVSLVVAATPFIRDKFLQKSINSIDVNNFPIMAEFQTCSNVKTQRAKSVCYVGGLTKVRGILEIVEAASCTSSEFTVEIAGEFSEPRFREEVLSLPGWSDVIYHGQLDRSGVSQLLSRSFAGLVTLHPTINYSEALPVKMFEYMAAGVPVIGSNIPAWKRIIDSYNCGICVDPYNPKDIARAMEYLFANIEIVREMGRNGQEAVRDVFNWGVEEAKLLEAYASLT